MLMFCLWNAVVCGVAGVYRVGGLITWGPAQQITGDTDVSTTGTFDRAYHFDKNTNNSMAVNGVTFSPFQQQTGDTFSAGGYSGAGSPPI